jgi:signal transduction histidine kinase
MNAQPVVKGVADLSSYDFEVDGVCLLSGEWEFYWNRMLTPHDFFTDQQPEWFHPFSWNLQSGYPELGYATYRMRLKMPPEYKSLSIYFSVINSSANIWVNGERMIAVGKVSADRDLNYEPCLSNTVISLPEGAREIELVIQVSNWTYFSGGLTGPPRLGHTATVFTHLSRVNGVENFFAGSLIAMFLYQLILYFHFQRGKPHLWLALICLGVALRALIIHRGSLLLPNLFPALSLEIWKKLEFGSIYSIVAFFPLYVFHLFSEYAPKKPLFLIMGISAGLIVLLLLTPQYIYGNFLDVAHLGLLMGFIYAVYSISRAWVGGNADARVILLGVLVAFPFILAEILKNTRLLPLNIDFPYLVEIGVLVFLVFQVYLLANHYSKAYYNLEASNQNLETAIQERTSELVTANTVKDRLLSVISHDIRSPLNSLRGAISMFNRGVVTNDEFRSLTAQIENGLDRTSMLVDNILHWTAAQLKGIQSRMEPFNLYNLVKSNVQLFDAFLLVKKISVYYDIPQQMEITSERDTLNLVLRNLLSNAIKFSFELGRIDIHAHVSEHLQIDVCDQGTGMDAEMVKKILSQGSAVSTAGTDNERGTGLGLALCREYLEKAGGTLCVESTPGKGTTFRITLPLG